ncbi:uncharacterized protein K460DRAFT_293919 [Cucurbitaria berberidis CBS 394.84]|uniref:Uncharacterized protein n=1 Tax=Cucurbitaria berberidis CBS 394.84 TaxID=1168544 RepID=A0A9P4GB52_9PLEO|nr:uncharacterized protein K460DRAFT_293919 [Cucurbitaria berberidis CBS 394.84]KAF1842156.1 hypothetical protein K460DRAFT_293919 [Cucurbitaria berberidis CBS 394.84]
MRTNKSPVQSDDNADTAVPSRGSSSSNPIDQASSTAASVRTAIVSSISSNKITAVTLSFKRAIRVFKVNAIDAVNSALEALRKLGIIDWAKLAGRWMKEHPWQTVAMIVPLILLACTPAILGAMGFTPVGVAAGTIAAGIQAGIGNIVVGSTFAIFTSAAMGGYGVPIVFGGIWVLSSTILGGIAAWKPSKRKDTGGESVHQVVGYINGGDGQRGAGDSQE